MKWFITVMIILSIILTGCSQSENSQAGSNQFGKSQPESSQPAADNRKYNLDKYYQIKREQTYDEVVAILGDPGVAMVDNERLKQYQWTNDDESNISVTFYDLKVTAKSQGYLGPFLSGSKAVTLSMYKKLQEGMTLEEVTKILGPGVETMLTTEGGKEKIIVAWNNSNGGNIVVTLLDGKVVKLSEMMLK